MSTTTQPHTWRRLTARIALIVAGVAVIAISQSQAEQTPAEVAPVSAQTATIYEDDPRWDCRTMGNLICGEEALVHGVPVPAGDYSHGDQVEAPVGDCLSELGYTGGPVVRSDAEYCATRTDEYAGNKLQWGNCEARGLLTAEDYSCVPVNFYDRER